MKNAKNAVKMLLYETMVVSPSFCLNSNRVKMQQNLKYSKAGIFKHTYFHLRMHRSKMAFVCQRLTIYF